MLSENKGVYFRVIAQLDELIVAESSWLCCFLYRGKFSCPGENEVENKDHIEAKVLIWDLEDLGLIPSTDFLGQTA